MDANGAISSTDIIISILITIASELLVFWMFIKRFVPKKEIILWVIFIPGLNCLSNPLAQLLFSALPVGSLSGYGWFLVQALLIVFEALLINKVMLKPFYVALFYSALLNGTSLMIGEILCFLNLLPWCH